LALSIGDIKEGLIKDEGESTDE